MLRRSFLKLAAGLPFYWMSKPCQHELDLSTFCCRKCGMARAELVYGKRIRDLDITCVVIH